MKKRTRVVRCVIEAIEARRLLSTSSGVPAMASSGPGVDAQLPTPEGPDPDDQISEAIDLGGPPTSVLPLSASGSLDDPMDVDMYRFTVSDGQEIGFDLDTAATNGLNDSILRLFDSAGDELAFNDDGAAPGESFSFESYLPYTFDTGGTYYIGVSGYDNGFYDPLTGTGDVAGDTGGYSLTGSVIVVPVDSDDQISEAIPLGGPPVAPVPIITNGAIDFGTDVDMYSFSVNAGQRVAFDIDTAPSSGLIDSWIRLFDASGNQLAFNDDGAAPGELDSYESYLDYTFSTGGTYYLGVSSYPNGEYDPLTGTGDSFGGTGNYTLTISEVADLDDQISEAVDLGGPPSGSHSLGTSGAIDEADDVDMYRFTVTAGQRIGIDLDQAAQNGLSDSWVRLFNSSGTQLAFNNDGAAPDEFASGDSYLEYTFATSGTYYVGVSGSGNSAYDPVTGSGDSPGDTGAYTLTISLNPGQNTSGAWSMLAHAAPAGIGTMMLLPDGSVMAQQEGISNAWYRLTPDASGSYVNGTWSSLSSMSATRLYYGSQVLRDGRVLVIGGEYSSDGDETNTGEIYNPVTNTWTGIAPFPDEFGDGPTAMMPDGRVLAGFLDGTETYIYDPASDSWTFAAEKLDGDINAEENWVQLPDHSILSYNITGNPQHAQRYDPTSNTWIDSGAVPVQLADDGGMNIVPELGPGLLLPDHRVFYIGATNHTALYTPAAAPGGTGSWAAGPDIANAHGAFDAPAAMLPNGLVLFTAGDGFNSGTDLYVFDPTADTIATVWGLPPMDLADSAPFYSRMLMLPSGQVLYSNGSNQLAAFSPTGSPANAWRPTIGSIVANGGGTYSLSGTQLNGISEGASYGDDAQMSTNYPLVRLTDGSGHVTYARTHDWSSTGVATGSLAVTTQFTLPAGLASGTYSLQVVASGIASGAINFVVGPASATPGTPALTIATDSGAHGDGLTNFNNASPAAAPHFTVTGTSAGSLVSIFADGVPIGSAVASGSTTTVTADGSTVLSDGNHSITANQSESGKSISLFSSALVIHIDTVAPTISASYPQFNYLGPAQSLQYLFSEPIANATSASITVTNTTTATAVPIAVNVGAPNAIMLTWASFNGGTGRLTDGNYSAAASSGITDLAGNPLSVSPYTFFFLNGDANHDGIVNVADLSALASNWQGNSKVFSQGDFNYDGKVDQADLQILAGNWNKTPAGAALGPLIPMPNLIPLSPPAPPPVVTTTTALKRTKPSLVTQVL